MSGTADLEALAADWSARFADSNPQELLRAGVARFGGRIALVSSFGTESAVLLHMLAGIDKDTPVLFLNTGKLFGETLRYRTKLVDRLGLTDCRAIAPDGAEEQAQDKDGLLWRLDPNACCALRKVRPLAKALAPFDAWITGRKRYQSGSRAALPLAEVADGMLKLNPLANWDRAAVEAYLDRHDLPRHPLEADGFLSIGCMPCTDRVAPGDDIRSGRWRGTGKTECGIHLPLPSATTQVGAS